MTCINWRFLTCLQICHINSHLLQTWATRCASPCQNTPLNSLLQYHFLAFSCIIDTNEPPIAQVPIAMKLSFFETDSTNCPESCSPPGASLKVSCVLPTSVRAHVGQPWSDDANVNKVLFFTLTLFNGQETSPFFVCYLEHVFTGYLDISYFQYFSLFGVSCWSALK